LRQKPGIATPLVAIALLLAAAATVPAADNAAAAAPTPATAEPARTIPAEVPDVQLQDLAGKSHRLRDSHGRPRLYNFWATWCEPCRREIPLLNTLAGSYAQDHLEIVGIAVDFRDAVRDFVRKEKLHYTLLVGEEDGLEVAQQFGMDMALPFTVFADGQNRIIAVKVGELHREEATVILKDMRELRAGTASLEQTRAAISQSLQELATARARQAKPRG
jgi:thiol-disulfide isomerase/thioredoxin